MQARGWRNKFERGGSSRYRQDIIAYNRTASQAGHVYIGTMCIFLDGLEALEKRSAPRWKTPPTEFHRCTKETFRRVSKEEFGIHESLTFWTWMLLSPD